MWLLVHRTCTLFCILVTLQSLYMYIHVVTCTCTLHTYYCMYNVYSLHCIHVVYMYMYIIVSFKYNAILLWPVGPSLWLLSTGLNLYIYIFFLCPLVRVCVVYVIKEVASFQGLGQLMDVVCKRTCTQALQIRRKKAACS